MSFWKSVGKFVVEAGKEALQKGKETTEEACEYADRYANLSREELIRKFKNSSRLAEKMGIAKVMKDNGWSVKDDE